MPTREKPAGEHADPRASTPSAGVIGSSTQNAQRAGESDVGPLAPIDRGRRQTRCSAPLDQGIQPRVGARVGRLTGRTQQRRHRREADPPVEFRPAVASCSRSGPGRLRHPDPVQALPGEADDELVVEHGRRVDQTRATACRSPPRRRPAARRCPGSATSPSTVTISARLDSSVEDGLHLVGGRAATVEDDAAGAVVDKPARHRHADTAEPAGDDVGAVRAHHRLAPSAGSVARESRSTIPALAPPGDHVIVRPATPDSAVSAATASPAASEIEQRGPQIRVLVGQHPRPGP